MNAIDFNPDHKDLKDAMPIGEGLEMSDLYQATIIMSLVFIIFFIIPLTYLIVQQT